MLAHRWFWGLPAALVTIGAILVWPSFLERVTTGSTYEHWSRFVAMAVLAELAVILSVTKLFDYTLDLLAGQLRFAESAEAHALESAAADELFPTR
jgi:hypothetical protein